MPKQPKRSAVVFGADLTSPTRHSVVAELQLLKECCADSATIDETLRAILLKSLKSQGGLASLELPEKGIVGMSLNTHKSAAISAIVGGFNTLDSYRRAALESLRKHVETLARPNRNTIEWLKKECETREAENAALVDEMVLLTARLNEVMEYARKLAVKAKKSEEFLEKQSELLRKFPIRSNNGVR